MGNRTKAYTKAARWYNLAYLGFIVMSSIGSYLILANLAVFEDVGSDTSTEEVFLVLVGTAGIIAIIGIMQERAWAKWFAISIYASYIFSAIEGMLGSLGSGNAYGLMSDATIVLMRINRLVAISFSLIGIVLLLKKPRIGNNLEERE
jgi:hypothetical protein